MVGRWIDSQAKGKAMKLTDCMTTDEIFVHCDAETGELRRFNATAMYEHARTSGLIEIALLQLDEKMVEFVRQNRGITPRRLQRLYEPYLSQLLVSVECYDGKTLTVDGHHRIVKLWECGRKQTQTYFFLKGQWEPFLVEVEA